MGGGGNGNHASLFVLSDFAHHSPALELGRSRAFRLLQLMSFFAHFASGGELLTTLGADGLRVFDHIEHADELDDYRMHELLLWHLEASHQHGVAQLASFDGVEHCHLPLDMLQVLANAGAEVIARRRYAHRCECARFRPRRGLRLLPCYGCHRDEHRCRGVGDPAPSLRGEAERRMRGDDTAFGAHLRCRRRARRQLRDRREGAPIRGDALPESRLHAGHLLAGLHAPRRRQTSFRGAAGGREGKR
mmetsp:Transcript_91302/g.263481  ORF Transcript_91302/g.263481 Transcript_91302/m.263481 type:complete len:247 (-) Transcript_91302:721-1461(-)